MAEEDFRLLASVLRLRRSLGSFTRSQLATEAGVTPNTARSWLRRRSGYVEQVGRVGAASLAPGRPKTLWRVREEAAPSMQQSLERIYPLEARPAAFDLGAGGFLHNLQSAELHVTAFQAARSAGDRTTAEQQRIAARRWTRLAWEEFAQLEQADAAVPQTSLEELAKLEREVGGGAPPEKQGLRDVAIWLAQRVGGMMQAGVPPTFAARVLRARMEIRDAKWQIRLTAAAQAATIWADEGLAEEAGVGPDVIAACGLAADVVPIARRLTELNSILWTSEGDNLRAQPDVGEAVMLGLAYGQERKLDSVAVTQWLWFLPTRDGWRDEMAAAVVVGLRDAKDINWTKASPIVVPSVRRAALATRNWGIAPGALRSAAWDYAKWQADTYERLNDGSALSFVDSLLYRPASRGGPASIGSQALS